MIELLLLLACSDPQVETEVVGTVTVEAVNVETRTLPFYDSPDFTPRWLETPDQDFHRLGDFTLTDHHGQVVDRGTVDGHPIVASFFFTSCGGICPELTKSMARVDREAPPETILLSHSVTPDRDTVAVLRGFARKHGITSTRWHLLTGPRDQIYALGRDAYFVEEDLGVAKGEDDFLHTENLVLVDGSGFLRGIYNGLNDTAVSELLHDLEVLTAR